MSMQEGSRLFQALKRGGPTFGGWQMLPGTNHSRAICRSGIDWLCVDGEHGNMADNQMHEAVAAIAASGVSPVVRIAANEDWMVKRALDSGAHAICVPLLRTAADARRLVAAAKFPPLGTRGFGSPFPMQSFAVAPNAPPSSTEYLLQANAALVTIVQIETADALANVEGIAAVDGVDVLLVGPFDLGNNIGHPILTGAMDAELERAIDDILAAAQKHGKRTGIYCTSGEQAALYASKGFNMISVAADMIALPAYFSQVLSVAKGGSGQAEKVTGPYGR